MRSMRVSTVTAIAMVLAVFMPCKGVDAASKDQPVTAAIRDNDDATTKAAYSKLEEIRQEVLNLKPGVTPWKTGEQAFPHLQVLADRWGDPRSEVILKQLAKTGPKRIEGELERQTLAYAAERYLILLEDNRQYDRLLKGIDNPDERVKTIRDYFDANPDLLATKCYGTPNRPIVRMLLNEAERQKGAEVVDLLVRSQLCGMGHFGRYGGSLLEYAKKLGSEQCVKMPYLLQYIVGSANSNAVNVLEQWIRDTPNEDTALALTHAVAELPGGEIVLKTLVGDSRPRVAQWARTVLYARPHDGEPKLK